MKKDLDYYINELVKLFNKRVSKDIEKQLKKRKKYGTK